MSLSAFSLICGVTLYMWALPMLFLDKKAGVWRKRLMNSEDGMRVVGWVFAAIAVLALKTQYRLSADAEGFLVVVAWLMLVKSVIIAWFPGWYIGTFVKMKEDMTSTATAQMFFGFLMVAVAAFFTYLGVVLI